MTLTAPSVTKSPRVLLVRHPRGLCVLSAVMTTDGSRTVPERTEATREVVV